MQASPHYYQPFVTRKRIYASLLQYPNWLHFLCSYHSCCLHVQATPTMPSNTPHEVIKALTERTQDGGTEVVNAKAGKVQQTRYAHNISNIQCCCCRFANSCNSSGCWHCIPLSLYTSKTQLFTAALPAAQCVLFMVSTVVCMHSPSKPCDIPYWGQSCICRATPVSCCNAGLSHTIHGLRSSSVC